MDERLNFLDFYNVPHTCEKCGGVMVFKGVGEYHCEDCGEIAYDDYGKVRLDIEKHKGATAAEIEQRTGVSQKKYQADASGVTLGSGSGFRAFLHCEICGKSIRSGRFCDECETKVHRNMEEQQRQALRRSLQGYGKERTTETGQKRFQRDE